MGEGVNFGWVVGWSLAAGVEQCLAQAVRRCGKRTEVGDRGVRDWWDAASGLWRCSVLFGFVQVCLGCAGGVDSGG